MIQVPRFVSYAEWQMETPNFPNKVDKWTLYPSGQESSVFRAGIFKTAT
jgi:hypothetical protein